MAIQDEMFKAIEKEIDNTIDSGKGKIAVDHDRAKDAAKLLTNLSISSGDADTLTNQYIAMIKNICK